MPSNRDREHVRVPTEKFRTQQAFTSFGSGGGKGSPGEPSVGRAAHGQGLRGDLARAQAEGSERQGDVKIQVEGRVPGIYIEFESFAGFELALSSLEQRDKDDSRNSIELVAVRETRNAANEGTTTTQHATVFVPEGRVAHFVEQLEIYEAPPPEGKTKPLRANAYDRIATVRLAALRGLWTDDASAYPESPDQPLWWEVWLRRTDDLELARLRDFAAQAELSVGERSLAFPERVVTLVHGTANDLSLSLDVLGDIAELRRANETPTFFLKERSTDQADWVEDLIQRITHQGGDKPAVCVLDTGVNRGHPLLADALAASDCHTVDPAWGSHDHAGHGTEMAGLALLGDLVAPLDSNAPVVLAHRLESVKILPSEGDNDPQLFGAITAEAVNRPVINAPNRPRVFSLAITVADACDQGQPTSWSAAVDALAAGRSFDPTDNGLVYLDDASPPKPRLFVVSAGNVRNHDLAHLERSDKKAIQEPGQAWNALTVGAYTDKAVIQDPQMKDWFPLAERGELSPWSTTSVTFQKAWPIKPDVVLEGGNLAYNSSGAVDCAADDLQLLTTYFQPQIKSFVDTCATSAAGALAARLCAQILAAYPELWPETVRALVVHSAEWTPRMKQHMNSNLGKTELARLVQRYGFGVPDLDRALRSATNAVTLVVEDTIHPFHKRSMREIHFHDLPWPRETLLALGDAQVTVRVTLSYFIEPNPGRRGWQTRHRYQSHGLRFQVRGATQSNTDFRKRLNKAALDEDEKRPAASGHNDGWFLGPKARNRGSIHSDVLIGTAADIAQRGTIAVFPIGGWWKEQPNRDRSNLGARYALIVSIETDDATTDIWTPIVAQIETGVSIET